MRTPGGAHVPVSMTGLVPGDEEAGGMTDPGVAAVGDGPPPTEGTAIARRQGRHRYVTAFVLFVVFLVLLALSVWLYPSRGVVDRPAPFTLTMISARGPDVGAADIYPLTIVPNQAYSAPSDVDVVVAPAGDDLYAVHVAWTYSPGLCTDGQTGDTALEAGCGTTTPPYGVAGSEVAVSLPAGATILHCRSCQPGNPPGTPVLLAERDATVRPDPGLPDASVLTATPPAFPVTASWDFEVHDTAFAWAANGLTAEASLPIVEFQDDGNTGYGNVTVHYRIPGGSTYDWNDGPDPDHLSWTEPVSSALTAVQVAGIDNRAADADTRDVLIVGILLGTAGGALVGAIQEVAHARTDGERDDRDR